MPDTPTASSASATFWVDTVKTVGFPMLVAGALMYVGKQQIDKSSARADAQSEYITHSLAGQLETSNTVIKSNTECSQANTEVLKGVKQQLQRIEALNESP